MSTRSTTHFTHGDRTRAIVYRHTDGYPEAAGVDIRRFLDECAALEGTMSGPRFDDPPYLAAKYVVFLAEMFRDGDKHLNFTSVGVEMADPGDIEYRYTVDCGDRGPNGYPAVRCHDVDSDADVEIPGGAS